MPGCLWWADCFREFLFQQHFVPGCRILICMLNFSALMEAILRTPREAFLLLNRFLMDVDIKKIGCDFRALTVWIICGTGAIVDFCGRLVDTVDFQGGIWHRCKPLLGSPTTKRSAFWFVYCGCCSVIQHCGSFVQLLLDRMRGSMICKVFFQGRQR